MKTTKDIKQLYKAFTCLQTEDESSRFVRDLMTVQEIENFAARLKAAQMLIAGQKSYRQIAEETGMSTTTITRINQWIKNGKKGYKMVLDRIEAEGETKNSPEKHPE